MPMLEQTRNHVLTYCDRDLPSLEDIHRMFDFIADEALHRQICREYYAARYLYKLGEALNVSEDKLHAHVKFQIIQYAGIYEAIIVYLLWQKFAEHVAVTDIEFHTVFRRAGQMPKGISIITDDESEVSLCIESRQRTPRSSIKFGDKIDAAVRIGFIDATIGQELKELYKIRNGIHLETAVKNQIDYEIERSKLAFRRMLPFTRGIKGFLEKGCLPDDARPKQDGVAVAEAMPAEASSAGE